VNKNRIAVLSTALAIVICTSLTKAQMTEGKEKEIICTGKVVDAQGHPITGVKVTLYVYGTETNSFSYDMSPSGEVTTRANGSFSFSVRTDSDNYTYGYVVAEKEGLAMGWAKWDTRKGSKELDIELGQPSVFAGMVVDENDKPISEVQVSIYGLLISDNHSYLPATVKSSGY